MPFSSGPKLLPLALIGLFGGWLMACSGDDSGTTPTDDGGGGDGCANNPTADVPEDLRCLWEITYEGCDRGDGQLGRQLYWIMEGEVDADGNISGEERIWWFFPEEWNTPDCVDTVSLQGTRISTDLERLGCGTCEEAYQTTREVTTNNCSLGYNLLFEEDQDGLKQTLIFDTLTSNGEPNEDNKTLVFHRTPDRNGNLSTEEYARGNMTPSGAEHAPPYRFTWTGSACQRR